MVFRRNPFVLVNVPLFNTNPNQINDMIYVNNNRKRMVVNTNNLSDRGVGFDSWIRKRLITNIDLSQSHEAICESIYRINDVNWLRKEPILIGDEVIKNIIQREEKSIPTRYIHVDEQNLVDAIYDQKLDLYYKVTDFTHEQDDTSEDCSSAQQQATGETGGSVKQESTYETFRSLKLKELWDASGSAQPDASGEASSSAPQQDTSSEEGSFQTCNTYLKLCERAIPLYPFYKVLDNRIFYHRMYMHFKNHFYNKDYVAKYLFWDRDKNNPYHNDDCRISLHNDAVNFLQDFLDSSTHMRRKKNNEDPTIPMRRIQTKTTVIFNKTSQGNYTIIYGNILGLVQFGTGALTLVSGTLYDPTVYGHYLIHDDVFKFIVECKPFMTLFQGYHVYDYVYNLQECLSRYTNIVKTLLPWYTEQPPCIYNDVAYPIMDDVEDNTTEFNPNMPPYPDLPPGTNNQHPDLNQNIQWGKVAVGIGMIFGGICCVASGCIPLDLSSIDFSSIFRGGGGN